MQDEKCLKSAQTLRKLSHLRKSYKLMKYYVGMLNSSVRFAPLLLNLKMGICRLEAWAGRRRGVGDFFWNCRKVYAQPECEGLSGLSDFICWKPLNIILHLCDIYVDCAVKEAELCSGQVAYLMKCSSWTQQTVLAAWQTTAVLWTIGHCER